MAEKKPVSGNLKDIKLIDLFVLLCTKKEQAGKLVFSNKDEKAEVYIEDGKIVHAVFPLREGLDALYNLLTWNEGDFEFLYDVKAGKVTIDVNTKQLLTDCLAKRKELIVIQELIKSPDDVFKLTGRSTSARINLNTEDLSVVSFLDGTKSIRKIEEMTGRSRYELFKMLYKFLSFDVIEKVEQIKTEEKAGKTINEPLLDAEVINKLEEHLKITIGPSAKVILDTSIDTLGYTITSFPESKLDNLIFDLVKSTGISEKSLRDIVSKKVKPLLPPGTQSIVGKEFFDNIEKRLKAHAGPSASLILESCVEDLQHDMAAFPISKLDILLDNFLKESGTSKKDITDVIELIEKVKGTYNVTYPTQVIQENTKKGGLLSFFKRK
ncbi:MAG: DUF4388 domain-containing protein [Candidatus Eremiobacterota bacterium]